MASPVISRLNRPMQVMLCTLMRQLANHRFRQAKRSTTAKDTMKAARSPLHCLLSTNPPLHRMMNLCKVLKAQAHRAHRHRME